ncbi:MarR family winged helix-turn-helix transcriptional regulator [Dyella sp. 20L07]|uniref:MarR family winged helix-turn-helix transcriptional regulator n=1 Tax=Dyella sp. 20L07 TaxID=3384240 RepID=UPI003D2C4C5C
MKSPSDWRPHEMPSLIINRLARLLSKRADEELAAMGLTASQLPVLASLKEGAKLTQRELADLTAVAQPSMAQLLARMERDGLVQRTPSTTDGRISLISLTPRANRMLDPGRLALRRINDEICSVLTQDERDLLTTVLQKLVRHADHKPELSRAKSYGLPATL